jgi:hypothetical protein
MSLTTAKSSYRAWNSSCDRSKLHAYQWCDTCCVIRDLRGMMLSRWHLRKNAAKQSLSSARKFSWRSLSSSSVMMLIFSAVWSSFFHARNHAALPQSKCTPVEAPPASGSSGEITAPHSAQTGRRRRASITSSLFRRSCSMRAFGSALPPRMRIDSPSSQMRAPPSVIWRARLDAHHLSRDLVTFTNTARLAPAPSCLPLRNLISALGRSRPCAARSPSL